MKSRVKRKGKGNVLKTRKKSKIDVGDVLIKYVNRREDPVNDFYSYVNESWLNSKQVVPSYLNKVDDVRLMQDKVYVEMMGWLKVVLKRGGLFFDEMRNAYRSYSRYMTMVKARSIALEMRKDVIGMESLKDMLVYHNRNDIVSWGSPVVWSKGGVIEPPMVSLVDPLYYEDGKVLKKYRKYLSELFKLAFGEGYGYDVGDVILCERKILGCMGGRTLVYEDVLDGYWLDFAARLGHLGDGLKTTNWGYFQKMKSILEKEWNDKHWQCYWIYIHIRQMIRLTKMGEAIHFEFYGNVLQGQPKQMNHHIKPIFAMCYTFHSYINNAYHQQHYNEEIILYTQSLAEKLKQTFVSILLKNKWMESSTRTKLINKIKKIKIDLASNVSSVLDPLLNYDPDDPWNNLMKIGNYYREHNTNPMTIEWRTSPPTIKGHHSYLVNAMYIDLENKLHVPVAYLQHPFVDLRYNMEYNLANIGFTIAHELSHAIDMEGVYGLLSSRDKKCFLNIKKSIINQYDGWAAKDGINYNSSIAINENIADISGLYICQTYLQNQHHVLPIKIISLQQFYIYFAMRMKQKINKKSIEIQLKTNPHPLDKYRCNIPLSRSAIFRAIFNVRPNDPMFYNQNFNNIWV